MFGRVKDFIMRSVCWKDLRGLGESRLITSSYLWLFLIPVAAKVLDRTSILPELRRVSAAGLPNEWVWFYLSSAAFAAGQTIYYLACPRFVKQFASFSDFVRQRIVSMELSAIAMTQLSNRDMMRLCEELRESGLDRQVDVTVPTGDGDYAALCEVEFNDDTIWRYLYEVFENADESDRSLIYTVVEYDIATSRSFWLRLSAYAFGVGFVFFSLSAATNFLYVAHWADLPNWEDFMGWWANL